ncbi:MAG: enoyl-CoA hydratase / 3-hydroxyacyl-CoA dehydrogenase [Archaeoglobaceae archaeon]|nr:enoyl-CoA hydratase / 3-hydroxyacyl-CoA dehydrogenase [Archaeoglobaceae archaeon]MDK2877039.1 enoyl-CoA hydratase / 3-hydroxyacyl-CoA dehydrogenase [Archaeoglobaceae archaeon]
MDAKARIKKIAVLGAGLMGHGIAEVCAMAGYEVAMRDIKQEFLDKGMSMIKDSLVKMESKGKLKEPANTILGRIKPVLSLEEAVKDADLIIEAIPEIFDLKVQTFKECDRFAKRDCIFTSNTSTMSITELSKATERPDRFAGLHFFNPPVLMKLVEVIRGEKTSNEVMDLLVDFVKSIGKVPVRVEKDVPGFIANRVTAPSSVLLLGIIEKGVATPEEVDAKMKSMGQPMGPFELMDYVGIDTQYHILQYYEKTIGPDYKPPEFLEEMVKTGKLGAKSGKGWYDWSKGRPEIDLSKASEKINPMDFMFVEINEAVKLVEMGVATPQDIDTALKLGYNRPFGPFEIAKNLSDVEISARLEELAKFYGKKIFEPAKTLKEGKLSELLKKFGYE